ncbi:hypothetical protein SIN8267_01273 [Sinobacterium norvegicum]|uniref:Uncharacterized protein n=1 Tax=Sinobacterium norvegicum TaxID=1641715 RepID=A0ABM9ADA0_9GAMM|nr:PepSY domain-containing protein [Sinobacterium norvegicum]CAH0991171.1 hypothetical protein SIN8267_01273 [Sinobacterium norvegicum]
MINRLLLMKIHTVLAAFALPIACMFLVTGALYTWGIKGDVSSEQYTIELQQPLQPELDQLIDLAEVALRSHQLSTPSGGAKIKTVGDSFMLQWGGAQREVLIEPTADPGLATLTINEASGYKVLVQLHKAKGSVLFKIYATLFAGALLLLILSGFIMAWQTPKLKKMAFTALAVSVASFIGLVLIS